jgi:hypothetical protein
VCMVGFQVNLVIIYLQTKEIEKRIKKIYKLHRSHRYCSRNHPCTIDREISREKTCKMTVVPFTWSPRRETSEIMCWFSFVL